jgi:hypothetical protein
MPDEQNQQPQPQQPAAQPAPAAPAPAAAFTPPAVPNAAPAAPAAPAEQKKITITFESDLQFDITADKIDDMRFMDLYAEVSEDELKIPKLMRFLLGDAEYDSIFTYYESRGQRFTITKFGEVFERLDKDLNAQPDFLKR